MADRYWVGGTGTWDTTAGSKWSTQSGGTGGASVPGAADVAIFDSNSNPAGSGASYTVTRTATAAISGLRLANPSAGTLTFAGTGALPISGNDGLVVGATVNYTATGLITYSGTTTTFTTNGNAIAAGITVPSSGGSITLSGNTATSGTLTFSAGTISLGSNTLSCNAYTSSGTQARNFNFGTGTFNVTSTATTTVFSQTGNNLTVSGNKTVNITGNAAAGITRTITTTDNFNESNALSFNITAGAGTVQFTTNSYALSLNTSGFTGTVNASSSGAIILYGSLLAGSTNTAVTADLVFISTGSGNTITSNGKLSNSNFTFNGAGGSWTLQDSFSLNNSISDYACELIRGTLNLNNNTLTLNSKGGASSEAAFRSIGSLPRTLNFGSSGSIVTNNTGTGTYAPWNTNETLSILGTPSVTVNHGNSTGFPVANINVGNPTESNSVNFTLLSPNGGTNVNNTINLNGTAFRSILMAGMTIGTITFNNTAITLYGSFSLPTTTGTNVTFSANANAFIFASTQVGNTITTNGRAMFRPLTFNSAGGAWTLQDALNMGTNALTLTAGTLNTGGVNVTAANISSTGTSTRSLTLGASTITLSATGATAFWDVTSTGLTLSSGTSTIVASGAAPTFNGAGLTYNTLTFNNAAVSAININGTNTFGTVTFTRPTSVNYVPVTFSANQTMTGLTFSGATAGNFRFLFNSSVLGTQRTLTLNGTLTALNDTDFRDIAVTGSSAPWTGTRLGNATNNSGITFTTAKTVWWGGSNANWSGTTWALTNGGATSADNFPLPQDTVNIASGPAAIVNYNYTIGPLNISSGGTGSGLSIATGVTAYMIGNVTVTSGAITASVTQAELVFYSPTGVTTPIVLTYNASARMRVPITINCAGGFQLGANLNTVSATLGTGFTLSHVRGTFETQNFALTAQRYVSLNTPGYSRSLVLGSSTVTLVESAGDTAFQVETENYTLTAGTSTVSLTGEQFDFLSDGNLTFYNLSLTSALATHQRIFASTSYFNNSNVVNKINFTVSNNFAITGRSGTGDENALIRFMGINSITVSGTFSVSASSSIVKRTTLFSEDDIMTISATTLGNLSDTDFSGITASGASAPWSGTRLGNAGRNSNITFTAPKTVYFAQTGNTNYLWQNTSNWSATPGGAASVDNFPLAQDTAVFSDTYPGLAGTLINGANYCFPALDFSTRTVAMTLNIRTECITAANVNLPSAVSLSNTGGTTNYGVWNLTGSNQTFTTSAGKNILQHIRIISNGTVQLGSSITITDTDGIEVISGTLDINGFVVTTPKLSVYYPSTKTLAFGAGSITVNGNNTTIVNAPYNALAGLTVTGTPTVNLTYSGATGTRVVETAGMAGQNKSVDINITAGTDIITVGTGTYPSGIRNYNLQGFAGTWSHNLVNLYGNLTVGSTVATIQDVSFDYVGTGASTLTSSGKTLRGIIEIDSAGSLALSGNLILTAFSTNLSYLKLTSGTFNASGSNVTADRVISTGSSTRTLAMGSGIWTITADDSGSVYAWDMSPGTNLTVQASSSTIRLTSSGPQTFNGGAKTYNIVSIGGVGPKYIRQNNTFDTFNNTVQPCTVLFGAGETQSFTNFSLAGTAGNLVTVGSTSTTNAVLYKLSAWNVGANSVNAGNNTGLLFVGGGSNDYLSLSYITGTNTLTNGISISGITGSGFTITF